MPHYLFGPVSAAYADRYLRNLRASGACLAFGYGPGLDLPIAFGDSWDLLRSRFPAGWEPDFVALYLGYATVPPWLWDAPVPLVGLAPDWNLQFHHYRRSRGRCDLVLTDAPGVEVFRRDGCADALSANLYGLEPAYLERPPVDAPRDIDVLFAGSLHYAVQRERVPWLGRLAALGGRWRVKIATGVFGADYRALLRRARIVFNKSARGECNLRTFEAAACGALLFQEAGNAEIAGYLPPDRACVTYDEGNLEALLEHYLTHEDERRVVAAAATAQAPSYRYEALWEKALEHVEGQWPQLVERGGNRPVPTPADALLSRTEQALCAADRADTGLVADLNAAVAADPRNATLHVALGLAVALAGPAAGEPAARAELATGHFRRALLQDPGHLMAALNLVEALVGMGQSQLAADGIRRTLPLLDRAEGDHSLQNALRFPPGFDVFRVEWDKAAWHNAGRPAAETRAKRDLLRWRLCALLADITGDSDSYHEAALARPDLPATRAALGCALARAGKPEHAVTHLRRAVAGNPFDRDAARALFQVLHDSGAHAETRRLARERRRLRDAAPGVIPAEPWFTDTRPVGDELASIIVLCCDQLEYTRQCLESVLRHTRAPYELLLVDNSSNDGTLGYLEEVARRPGPARVQIIRNDTNVGFPAGCNQGLAQARGEYVIFLNNDTIVTPHWLDGLVGWALHDWPSVGLVGAVTNYTRPPQQVPAGYADTAGIDAFAASRRREFAGRMIDAERLTGFCLLARRDVLQRLGGFDERFGLGFFDDDDLSVRARQAGFRLLVALDVFVHHFGSRTFTGLGVDCSAQLRANFEQFQAKWGPEHSAGYRVVGPAPPAASVPTAAVFAAAQPPGRARVSLCLIVRNEEHNLPACLESAAGLFDEIVVVDTGSTDGTKAIALRHGAKVFDFPWCDSFAAARNEGLRHATGDWIFWLDADDRLDAPNREKLRTLFAGLGLDNAAYCLKCLCVPDAASGTSTLVDHIRLFRNHPGIRWRYRVHEQILSAVRELGGEVRWADVVIQHTGYRDPALRGRKLERDLRLLNLENADRPDDPFTLFNLGSVYQEMSRHAEAIPLLRRSLERSHPRDSIVRKLYALIAGCHRHMGQTVEALAVCRDGLGHCPDDVELLFVEGMLRRDQGDLAGAKDMLLRVLASQPEAHFASVDAGLRGYKTRNNLAVILQELGQLDEAENQWRAVVAERPDFLPAWVGLGELYLKQERWADVEELARSLETEARVPLEGLLFRARAHLARREFAEAQLLVRQVIAAEPRAVWPRVLLSHVLLQEGRDLDAAELALRDVLALDPQHAEARNNLAVLMRNRERAAGDQLFAGGGNDPPIIIVTPTDQVFEETNPNTAAVRQPKVDGTKPPQSNGPDVP